MSNEFHERLSKISDKQGGQAQLRPSVELEELPPDPELPMKLINVGIVVLVCFIALVIVVLRKDHLENAGIARGFTVENGVAHEEINAFTPIMKRLPPDISTTWKIFAVIGSIFERHEGVPDGWTNLTIGDVESVVPMQKKYLALEELPEDVARNQRQVFERFVSEVTKSEYSKRAEGFDIVKLYALYLSPDGGAFVVGETKLGREASILLYRDRPQNLSETDARVLEIEALKTLANSTKEILEIGGSFILAEDAAAVPSDEVATEAASNEEEEEILEVVAVSEIDVEVVRDWSTLMLNKDNTPIKVVGKGTSTEYLAVLEAYKQE